jgi:hypothetical protein
MILRPPQYAFSAAKIDYENAQADHELLSRVTTIARHAIAGVSKVVDEITHAWIIDELREAEHQVSL